MDTKFTMNGVRYITDCDTYRVIFELLGTEAGDITINQILKAGLKLGEIKEVYNGTDNYEYKKGTLDCNQNSRMV